jgi:ParB family transcriptional regulator, chromosome partitioning protein
MSKPTTGIKSLAEGRSDIFHVDPRKLKIKSGWNSRDFNDPENIAHVDDLAQSIAAVGVKEPLTVYFEDGEAWISNGECRLRGTMRAIQVYKAEIKTVPVRPEDRYANEADRLLNQFLRNTGKRFSAIELSSHFKRLLGMGWQAKDIAKKAGMSAARISQILELQTLPETVKSMVVQQQVSASTAAALVKTEGGTKAEAQLKAGLATAQAEGKTKVTAKHLTGSTGTVNIRTALKEAFEYADIDNSEIASQIVVVKFPADQFEVVRNLLDL